LSERLLENGFRLRVGLHVPGVGFFDDEERVHQALPDQNERALVPVDHGREEERKPDQQGDQQQDGERRTDRQ